MSEKYLAPYRAAPRSAPKPGSKTLARQADALSARMLKFLSDTPALTAASVLSDMLRDTSDPATRLAILTTRIQVLRARTIACRLGHPVDGKIKLGEVLEEQRSTQLSPEIPDPTQAPAQPEPESTTARLPPEDVVHLQLLENYTHEGLSLPTGATFAVAPDVAQTLVARGVASLLPVDQSAEQSTDQPTDQPGTPPVDATDAAQTPTLKPYDPDAADQLDGASGTTNPISEDI